MANKELILIKERKKSERAKRLDQIRATGKILSVTSLVPFFEENKKSKKGDKAYDI